MRLRDFSHAKESFGLSFDISQEGSFCLVQIKNLWVDFKRGNPAAIDNAEDFTNPLALLDHPELIQHLARSVRAASPLSQTKGSGGAGKTAPASWSSS